MLNVGVQAVTWSEAAPGDPAFAALGLLLGLFAGPDAPEDVAHLKAAGIEPQWCELKPTTSARQTLIYRQLMTVSACSYGVGAVIQSG